MADPDRACEHLDFLVDVEVNRLTQTETSPAVAYIADMRVTCAECSEAFRFIGMNAGLVGSRPMCSIDEATAHLPIRPASSDPDFGLGIPGFAIQAVARDG